ncbi:MAG: hypothetical protein KGJ88_14065 [Verrucomicrobiota bacterium]|nr:hypothetical protein [Verrucomicrobiota bacterium]
MHYESKPLAHAGGDAATPHQEENIFEKTSREKKLHRTRMQSGAWRLGKMNKDTEQITTAAEQEQWLRGDKLGLAAHYSTGVRTIENWLAAGLITGRKAGRKLEFDFIECDRRLMSHKD